MARSPPSPGVCPPLERPPSLPPVRQAMLRILRHPIGDAPDCAALVIRNKKGATLRYGDADRATPDALSDIAKAPVSHGVVNPQILRQAPALASALAFQPPAATSRRPYRASGLVHGSN